MRSIVRTAPQIRSQGACGAFYFGFSRNRIKNQPYKRRLIPLRECVALPGGVNGERRTHRSGEGCPKQSAGSARQERRLRPTQKCACPCQAKVFFTPHIYRKECRKQVLFSIPRSHFSAENSSFCPPHFVLFFCPARYSGTASFLAATNFLLRSLNCHNVNLAWVPLIPKAWEYFQLLEPQTLVKTVGVIIFFVAPHLHCFYLQK